MPQHSALHGAPDEALGSVRARYVQQNGVFSATTHRNVDEQLVAQVQRSVFEAGRFGLTQKLLPRFEIIAGEEAVG